jgi:recombination protein RecT
MGTNLAQRAQGNAPAKTEEGGGQTIGGLIQSLRGEMQRALPKHMDADRMARLALTMVRKTPKLAECTPESFAGALLSASAIGLEPGVNDECYLVPYYDSRNRAMECQLIIGYQGYAKLFWQSPLAAHLDAQAVYANDTFDYAYGLKPFLDHRPARGDRGEVVEYYAVASLTTGASAFVVLSADDVKKLRAGKVGPSGNIIDPMRWMERKTAIRQLVKLLPKSANLAVATKIDERDGSDLRREQISQAVNTTPAALPAASDDVQDISAEWIATPDDGGQPADPAPTASGDELTSAQLGKLQALLKKEGLATSEARHEWLTSNLRRDITDTKQVTKAEASELIDYLVTEQAKDGQ